MSECPVPGCLRTLRGEMVLCLGHWIGLDLDTRRAVMRHQITVAAAAELAVMVADERVLHHLDYGVRHGAPGSYTPELTLTEREDPYRS